MEPVVYNQRECQGNDNTAVSGRGLDGTGSERDRGLDGLRGFVAV